MQAGAANAPETPETSNIVARTAIFIVILHSSRLHRRQPWFSGRRLLKAAQGRYALSPEKHFISKYVFVAYRFTSLALEPSKTRAFSGVSRMKTCRDLNAELSHIISISRKILQLAFSKKKGCRKAPHSSNFFTIDLFYFVTSQAAPAVLKLPVQAGAANAPETPETSSIVARTAIFIVILHSSRLHRRQPWFSGRRLMKAACTTYALRPTKHFISRYEEMANPFVGKTFVTSKNARISWRFERFENVS
ncbi:hypothetical protein [Hyphomicrobium sp. MC8b]|uniref:hypothetical protein n=1 Tax=Hyphomicrobium sp. MC8b TaxID=300273 RepID=UPI00391DA6D4